jgi:hypothetical protein
MKQASWEPLVTQVPNSPVLLAATAVAAPSSCLDSLDRSASSVPSTGNYCGSRPQQRLVCSPKSLVLPLRYRPHCWALFSIPAPNDFGGAIRIKVASNETPYMQPPCQSYFGARASCPGLSFTPTCEGRRRRTRAGRPRSRFALTLIPGGSYKTLDYLFFSLAKTRCGCPRHCCC